jgi:hypothetical protein
VRRVEPLATIVVSSSGPLTRSTASSSSELGGAATSEFRLSHRLCHAGSVLCVLAQRRSTVLLVSASAVDAQCDFALARSPPSHSGRRARVRTFRPMSTTRSLASDAVGEIARRAWCATEFGYLVCFEAQN